MSRKASLAEVVAVATRGALARVRTGIPAKVTTYDPLLNTVDVEIVVDNPVYDAEDERSYETFPVIPSVPVMWPRAGGYVITLPLAAGDYVWLAFSELPLAEWRTTGQRSQPVDARRHSIGYPYATPGAFPDIQPLPALGVAARTSKMVMGEEEGLAQITIKKDLVNPEICLGQNATDFVALASKVDALFAAIANAVVVPNDGGAAIIAALNTALGTTPTVAADITKAK